MKWKGLSLKERKQIYDSVRVNNPDATYFDIKEQFDSIPAYEDGKNSKSDQAWKINETVRLGMEGKSVSQDSLQHIIDRSRMQNKPRPYDKTYKLLEDVDKSYGTNYKRAYANIAYKDMTKRGDYVRWGTTDKDGYGQVNMSNIKDNVLSTDINDYKVILDNSIYMPGTANHELGHIADGLAGSRKIVDFDSGGEYITNPYLNYLANPMEILMPLGGAGVIGNELNKQ